MTEQTMRADHVTPDVVGRKILVTTTDQATLMGEVTGYEITAKRHDYVQGFAGPLRSLTTSEVEFNLTGIVNGVTVEGDSEVKVLA